MTLFSKSLAYIKSKINFFDFDDYLSYSFFVVIQYLFFFVNINPIKIKILVNMIFFLYLLLTFILVSIAVLKMLSRYLKDNKNLKSMIVSFLILLLFFLIADFQKDKKQTIFLIEYFFTLILIPFYLSFVSEKFLDLLFHLFFRYKSYDIREHDFYTNELDYQLLIQKYQKSSKTKKDVYFLFTTLISVEEMDSKFKKIKKNYVKLLYFWYAYRYNRVYLRFILPAFAILSSILFFTITLFILDNIEFSTYSNIYKMFFTVLFLTVMYFSMLYHVNIFLDPLYYINEIDKYFKSSNINFKDIKYTQKILLYLDKTFLVNIYDKKYDRKININSKDEFESFILDGDLDKEGRDNIINIFVSLFMVIYLTIFVEVLVDSKSDKFYDNLIKENNSSKTIKHFNQKGG